LGAESKCGKLHFGIQYGLAQLKKTLDTGTSPPQITYLPCIPALFINVIKLANFIKYQGFKRLTSCK